MNRLNRHPGCARALCFGLSAGTWFVATAVGAADLTPPMRDPMLPPSTPSLRRAVDPDAAPAPVEVTPRHLVFIDGRRYLIVDGRRHAVGDMLGSARIERIDDGSVWLRDAGVLRQVSLFGGIVKRALPSAETASEPAATRRASRKDRPATGDASPPSTPILPTGSRS